MPPRKRRAPSEPEQRNLKRAMDTVSERFPLFDRSQHELQQLRFFSVHDTDAEKATLKSRLDEAHRRLEESYNVRSEQQKRINDLGAAVDQLRAENQELREKNGDCLTCSGVSQGDQNAHAAHHEVAVAAPRRRTPYYYRKPTVESATDEEPDDILEDQHHHPQQQLQTRQPVPEDQNGLIEIFLTFVSAKDSRLNQRAAVYLRRKQSLRDAVGPKLFGRFEFGAMAFVRKAQQIGDVGLTAGELGLEDRDEVSATWLEDVEVMLSG